MKNAERSNCHFAVQQASDGEPVLVVQLLPVRARTVEEALPLLGVSRTGAKY